MKIFMKLTGLTLFLLANISTFVHSANIVFYFGVSSYSHRIPAWPLAGALADKGHNVTFVSPFPTKSSNPKIRDYVPKKLKEWVDNWGDLENVFDDRAQDKLVEGWLRLPEFGRLACEVVYSDPEFINWVKNSQVDLLFIDMLFNDCAYGMASYWNAKIILYSTSSLCTWMTEPFGVPDETNWIPSMELFYPLPMTFTQRLKNALAPVAWDLERRWRYFPYLEQLTRDSLNLASTPSFHEIEKNVSLVFTNTHYGEEFARSFPPNVVPIGGIGYIEKKKPLPKEMEDFLRKGSQFIYVSFGTYADFNLMPESTQNAIVGAMNAFPQVQFVWKVDNDTVINEIPGRNVLISKWMPQQDILAHPKIKAFITHAGLLGTQEAIYNAVPLITFPIFAEQDYNAERVHRKRYGIRLEIMSVTQPELEDAISKVLTDPLYRRNIQTVSTVFQDRPQKPLDVALWWTDFVMRRSPEELATLRPSSIGQPWWQKRNLDVWLALAAIISSGLLISLFMIFKVLKHYCSSTSDLKRKNNSRKKLE